VCDAKRRTLASKSALEKIRIRVESGKVLKGDYYRGAQVPIPICGKKKYLKGEKAEMWFASVESVLLPATPLGFARSQAPRLPPKPTLSRSFLDHSA